MTEAQEKNHTHPIDLPLRTPLSQLMWRAVTYTHQARADGNTTPRPYKKKFFLFLGPPCMQVSTVHMSVPCDTVGCPRVFQSVQMN